jgi:hypothetical protein
MRTDLHQLVADYRRLHAAMAVYTTTSLSVKGQKDTKSSLFCGLAVLACIGLSRFQTCENQIKQNHKETPPWHVTPPKLLPH